MSEKDSSEDEADDIESTMCADNDDDDSRYAVMPNYFRHAPKAKEATPYYLKEKQGLDPVAEDDEVSEMPAPRPQSNKPPAKAGPKMYEGDNAGPSPKAKKPKASSAAKNSTGKSGDTTTQDMGTQFPDVMPAEVEFDEEEHEPPPGHLLTACLLAAWRCTPIARTLQLRFHMLRVSTMLTALCL